ncbi:MAG: ThuA domain-containing protein [Pedosphaera sp.]|nr:ThuA domain-containing protein [Pedosphaera sp.]
MKKHLLSVLLTLGLAAAVHAAEPKKVLVVTVTTGFRHSSIATAEKVIAKIGADSGAFTVDFVQQPGAGAPRKPSLPKKPADLGTDANDAAKNKYGAEMKKFAAAEIKYQADLEKFTADEAKYKVLLAGGAPTMATAMAKLSLDNLKNYDAVIFANTTGDLALPDKQGFIDWVKAGHGFAAMHSGSDTFHGFRPYIDMLGGEFAGHGAQEIVELLNKDTEHPATKDFGASWNINGKREEMYLFKSYHQTNVHELLVMDKHPNSKAAGNYPVAWCKEFGKGKVFYTSLGHNEYVWEMAEFQKHILGGIKWALGLEKGNAVPQVK